MNKFKGISWRLLSFLMLPFLFPSLASAAAFQLYELGAPINGTAAVGQAVVANDASIAYYNPAGMILLENSQLLLGSQLILPYTNFSKNASTTISGNNGSNAGSLIPGADAYFVYGYSPDLKFGVSLTAPFGGALSFNDHWVGRYYVQQMMLYTLNLNPAFSYRVNPTFAIGGGVAIEYANLNQSVALPIFQQVDGQATVKVDNTSPGFNLGILFMPSPATKLGVAYRSQIVHNLRGNISFFNIGITPNTTTKIVMPASIIASISQIITNHFTLLGELGWSNWSSMTNSTIRVNGFSSTTVQNWNNTYRLGLGGIYEATPALALQAGVSYDSSPTTSSKRLPNLPMDRQIRLGFGMNYHLIKSVKLGLSYEYINFGNADINNISSNGVLSGSFSRNYANVLQASLNVTC